MNTFGVYFKRHFMSTWIRPIIFSTFGILLLMVTINAEYNSWNNDYDSGRLITESLLGYVTIFTAIIATIVPILEFSHFNNKKNIDTLFSLPIDKTKMLLAHYINGILHITLSVTAIYVVWIVSWVYAPYTALHEGYSMLSYVFIMLGAIVLYTIYSAVFLQANTTVDGCAFMLLHSFVFFIMLHLVYILFHEYTELELNGLRNLLSSTVLPLGLLDRITICFDSIIEPHVDYIVIGGNYTTETAYIYEYGNIADVPINSYLPIFIFYILLAVGGAILTLKTFKLRSPLNVGEISDSWFGYKVLGPIFSICGVLIFNSQELFNVPFSIFVVIFMFLGYMLYRRGVKFKIPDIIVMSVTTLIAIFGKSLGL